MPKGFEVRTTKPTLLIIGALPPPAIGPSIANQRLLQADTLRAIFNIIFLDLSDRRTAFNVGKFDLVNVWLAGKHVLHCSVLLIHKWPAIVYLNLSQGVWGYLRDLGFIVPSIFLRRKIVLHLRGSEFGSFYSEMPKALRFITRRVFAQVSRVIVLGHTLKSVFKGLIADHRIAVIPNGIDYTAFDLVAGAPRSKAGSKILYVGSLQRRKGIFPLIEALPEIILRHRNVHLTFAGDWQSYDDRQVALSLINKLGIGAYVTFLGEVNGSAKIELYKKHDLFVFTPVEPEGLPWVVLEAMSAGLPVVTSDQGALSEVVQDGRTGWIIQPEPARIAEKVCDLLENHLQAITMGYNGRRRVEQQFSESAYLSGLERVFQQALHS